MCSRHGYSQPSKPHSSAPKWEYGKTWYMVHPSLFERVNLAGQLVNNQHPCLCRHRTCQRHGIPPLGVGATLQESGQTLEEERLQQRRVPYISVACEAGLSGQTMAFNLRPLLTLRTKERSGKTLEAHNVCVHSPVHSPPTRAPSSSGPGIDLRCACSEGRARRWWHRVRTLCAGGTGVYGSDRSVGESSRSRSLFGYRTINGQVWMSHGLCSWRHVSLLYKNK